jgi:hypothetical protein
MIPLISYIFHDPAHRLLQDEDPSTGPGSNSTPSPESTSFFSPSAGSILSPAQGSNSPPRAAHLPYKDPAHSPLLLHYPIHPGYCSSIPFISHSRIQFILLVQNPVNLTLQVCRACMHSFFIDCQSLREVLSILERGTDHECINNCSYSKKKCGQDPSATAL